MSLVLDFLIFKYCFFEKIKNIVIKNQGDLFRFFNFCQITYWFSYLEYIIYIIIVYKYGRVELLVYFKPFDVSEAIIGIPCFDKIRKSLAYGLIFGISICIFVCVFNYVAWTMVLGWHIQLMYAVDHMYFFFNMLTVLDVISHVIQVESRLKKMRDLLQVKNI